MIRRSGSAQERLGALSKERTKLFELLLQKDSKQTQQIRPFARDAGAGNARLPTSGAQRRLWFMDQLEGGSTAYLVPVAIRLHGELDGAVLQSALDALLERHEVLRTGFVEVDGEPVQEIAANAHFVLQRVDLRERGPQEREAQVLRHSCEEQRAPFDLSVGPLIRGRLLQLSPAEHVLLLTMHHMVADGWSIGVLIQELGELYESRREGRPSSLAPLPIQYADYAQWQQQWLSGAQLEDELRYWTEHLSGAPGLLEVPTDRPRPAVQSYRGTSVRVSLGPKLTADLKALSRRFNVTLAMTLHAAWSILLSRLGGQEDIVVGMPVANRRRTELEGLIGFFVNTLAVRVKLEDEPRVTDLLQRVKEVMLGAYAHQDVPFEKVVEALQPARSLSHSPIFQVMFTLQSASHGEAQLAGLRMVQEDVPPETAKFDLNLSLQESGEGLAGVLEYASDLFDAATIERWVGCFEMILRGMVREPQLSISRLPLMSEQERHRVIELFNATQAEYPQDKLIHQLFEQQVECTPHAIAVMFEEQWLTYAELNHKANRLARYLRTRGAGPDRFVGLFAERGIEMVVGLLGILKAGSAYVPLDPNYPLSRVEYMLKDTAPVVVLTQDRLRALLPEGQEVIALDSQWSEIEQQSPTNLGSELADVKSTNLAYVIYTSGSTGQPKGVAIEHRNAVNLIWWAQSAMAPEIFELTLQSTSLNFDLSVYECFVPLTTGGGIRVVKNALALVNEPTSVTLINTVPSAISGVLDSGGIPSTTRVVNLAGEALKRELVERIFARSAVEQVCNLYGPSETTTYSTWIVMSREEGFDASIGRPIANTQVYILDRYQQIMPIGTVGEIYIGGAGVARGYLNRPELTEERFVRDPFSADPQARMYKTGDLGRWRADGTIEYLGRNDHQVKIRGFRIELGEIESQLIRHEQVKEAVVIAREDEPGEKRLVAYVVPRDVSMAPGVEELRTHLRGVLPEHMVPTAVVTLEHLPLTPNGKLDRRALPAPELGAYVSRQHEAPQGEVEEILAGIWQSLLRVERVGRYDNFFELGGHSLLIVQLMERLRRVGLSAELRHVFESPTLADLAGTLTRRVVEQFEVPPNLIPPDCTAITPAMLPLVELEAEHIERIVQSVPGGAANVQDIYPLVPLQEGILFHHLLDDAGGDTYVTAIVLSVCSRERLEELVAALQAVIDRHDVLRTAVLWEQLPQPVQVVYRQATLPVEVVTLDQDRDPHEQTQEWIKPERQRLDLRQAPLVRLQVAEDARTGQWYVLLQTHHVNFDHVTLEIVVSEVVAHLEGRAQTLPASVPYRNHVAQSLAYARTHDAEAFFRGKLADIDEPTAPFGLLDVRGDGSRVEEAHLALDDELARRIRSQARWLGVSAATLMHAAWALVVAHTSGRDDVVFGSLLLGRLQGNAGAQQILGMFINTLPLRLQLQDVTAKGLVEQTQRELAGLLSHEQASLAVAQRCSGIEGSAPLFTALMNYRHRTPNPDAQWSAASGIQTLVAHERTNYPILLAVDDLGEGFTFSAQTDRRVDPRRITEYLHTAVCSLVEALEQAPQTQALSLPILPESERRQVIELFNATQAEYPQDKLIHQLFEEQVERTPDAVAVVYEGQSLTYAELNNRANQLARYLREKGVGPDQLVGICVDRSAEVVVGLLGILKAGGAYVPLDPNYPAERLAYMLDDAAPRVLLTQAQLTTSLPDTAAEVVALDDGWSEIARHAASNLDVSALGLRSDHLAYVIYTSGSTGKPKGAMNEHRALINRLQWMQDQYQLGSADRVLQKTPFSFDVSVWEFFWTLTSGARLIVARPQGHQDPSYLRRLIEEAGITTLHFVPSMLQIFLDQYEAGQCPSLRHVVCSGEELSPALQNKCLRALPHARLSNLYGPTEAAIDVTFWECQLDERSSSVPIGRPISNTQMYVLDRRGQPVPIGVAGEIFIGGTGVGRGYFNRPELTAQRFVRDPHSIDPRARLYKTGDLGRWRQDGAIDYLGRNDHQVKIRGFRIELGEIEAQLARHEQVKEAVVIAREDIPGERRLVAYVVPSDPSIAPAVEELRTHLKIVLPEHMVPSAVVTLERMPLTPNGKLDRRALPAPELGAYVSRQYEAPQGDVEEILAGIWQAVLRVEKVGRHDNFFELGGHSLLIVQLMERLRRVGLSAELRRVFESPTLSDLAGVLANTVVEQFEVPPNLIPPDCTAITPEMLPLVELEAEHIERIVQSVPGGAANIQDIYPLVPLQEGILFHHLLDDSGGDTYVAASVLSVRSRERLEELVAALQAVIDRHDVLRTAVLWGRLPQPVQVVYRQATLPVEVVTLDQDRDSLEQIREWLKPERQRLDLGQAPLVRLQVAEDARTGQWYVLLQTHHMNFDNVTLEIMVSEVVAQLEGRAETLPASVPYRNHVAQSLAYARTHDAEAFFRGKLADIDEPTAPFGLLDVHGDGSQIESAREEIELALALRVRGQARRLGVSAATLFHAAWAVVVAHTSGRDDVVFGSVLLGRLQGSSGAQRILGMFINTLPLRLQLTEVTARGLVEQTQRELIELLSHEQASLAVAQRCSGVTGTAPLFTALLNYRHSTPNPDAQWSAASVTEMLDARVRTNYPIALSVDDLGEGFVLSAQTDRRVDPRRITEYLRTAVCSLVDALEQAPQTSALSLPILPGSERRRVIEDFNATQAEYPRDRLIHQVFEQWVERTPAAMAVAYEGLSLTYAELNDRANQLARYLRTQGAEAGDYIAILMPRSLQMLVAQLAVLKSGCVYVPIDPEVPQARRTFMIRDCGARHVLTDGERPADLESEPVQWIDCVRVADVVANQSVDNLAPPMDPVPPAYVMYTSGSTGVPKGVVVPHHAINRLVINNGYAQIRPDDCIAHYSNPAFDASTFEVWGALLNGARVVIVPQSVVLEAARFAEVLEQQRVTVLWMTVGLFNQYTETLARVFSRLRYLITGGDSLDPSAIRRVLRDSPPQHLINGYGPTECTTFATTHLIRAVEEEAKSIPIGRPISNAQIYILDARRQPVPVGVPGEIYIGGDGVACGYLNRPELTAERFIPDPFSGDGRARLYRTGDLGRWRADGVIEFLGRNDHQLKIRGFRVELGEIEAQLARHAQVREAAVVARAEAPGEKRLVAYVTQRGDGTPSADELRAHLKSLLPEYMVPSAFVVLQSLPLTSSGKLNRRALPAPDLDAYASRQYEPPQGEVEEMLAIIWQEVLQMERVGREDNFFELGGHSLLALKAVFRINESLDAVLRVTDAYKSPTIRELAARIRGDAAPDEFVDLSKEAWLDSRIVAKPGLRRTPARAVLLTGGTGFVGRFLLAQLLQDTEATIYCLVRAQSQHRALSRLRMTLSRWDLWRDEFEPRIVAVPGDLRLPRLGIDEVTYQTLCRDVDSIYHCATSMNHLETYAMAKPANVEAARELLELATSDKPKLINYISTLGVFSPSTADAPRVLNEASSIDHEKHSTSIGYTASKWVGEKIFMHAGERGIPCNIFRLGLVWGDTQQGRYDELQHHYRLFKSCLLSGRGIENYRHEMPPTPVDYVARAVVFLASRHRDGQGIFHISSSDQMNAGVFERCNEIAGTQLDLLPLYDWIGEIKRLHHAGRSLPVVPLIEYAFSMNQESFQERRRRNQSASIRFDCARTHRELELAGIVAPVLNDDLLRVCVESMFARDPELQELTDAPDSLLLIKRPDELRSERLGGSAA